MAILSGKAAAWSLPWMLVIALVAASPAPAGDTYWQVTRGDWFVDANWTNGVPTAADDAYVGTAAKAGLAEITSGDAKAFRLFVGDDRMGSVQQTGGTNTCSLLELGLNAAGDGTY